MTRDAAFETTFDEDGFADFESDEDVADAATTNDAEAKEDAIRNPEDAIRNPEDASLADPMPDPTAPLSVADRQQFDAMFDVYTADAPPGSSGLSGAQLVQITANAGVANADLSLMWRLAAAPGADALRRDDFVLFCRLLKQRAAGAPLPPSIDAAARARFFAKARPSASSPRLQRGARRRRRVPPPTRWRPPRRRRRRRRRSRRATRVTRSWRLWSRCAA